MLIYKTTIDLLRLAYQYFVHTLLPMQHIRMKKIIPVVVNKLSLVHSQYPWLSTHKLISIKRLKKLPIYWLNANWKFMQSPILLGMDRMPFFDEALLTDGYDTVSLSNSDAR